MDGIPKDVESSPSPLFPFAEGVAIDEGTWADSSGLTSDAFRTRVLERDGWRCQYPGCTARRELDAHHIRFRSHGGPNEPWNGITLCRFHQDRLHVGQIAVEGRAPHELEWTPPKLMREVLERSRNRKPFWPSGLEVVAFPREPAAGSVSG